MDLKHGFVSSLIFKEGGKELQDEIDKKYGTGIYYGEIAITSRKKAGGQKIFHGALYNRNDSPQNDRGVSQRLSLKV